MFTQGGPGEGLGIVVQEEPDGRNVVKAVKSSLRIKSITGEVGEDGIEAGDELLQIEGVDVSNMPLLRGKPQPSCTVYSPYRIVLTVWVDYNTFAMSNSLYFILIVAQRMNDFRIPPYTAAKLTFGRKVLREELNPDAVSARSLDTVAYSGIKQTYFYRVNLGTISAHLV